MRRLKLIGLADLPDSMRVYLKDRFRKRLIERAIEKAGGLSNLATELNYHTDSVRNIKNGKSSIKTVQLKKLSKITSIPLEKIELNISQLRTKNKKRKIGIKFPIFATSELASVIGHCIGDGSLSAKQFSFFNKRRELIDGVIKNIQIAFSSNTFPTEFRKDGGWEIEFPTGIAKLIEICGGPVGKKVFSPFKIPLWVMNGTDQIKSYFLSALFDDEGWIKIKVNKKTKTVNRMVGINMSKNISFISEHLKFFEDIKKLLSDLGIRSSEIKKMGKTKNGESLGIIISNFNNLSKFFNTIGFTNVIKQKKLLEILTNSDRFEFVPELINRPKTLTMLNLNLKDE